MSVPKDLKFTKEHEWLKLEGKKVRVGITDYAQKELGDVVFVDLPQVGRELKQGESFGTVESVKAVSDIYSPVSGKVAAVNEKLNSSAELVNSSPYETGWLIEIDSINDGELGSLLDASSYEKLISEAGK